MEDLTSQSYEETALYSKVVVASIIGTFFTFYGSEYILNLWNPSFTQGLTKAKKTCLVTHVASDIHAVIVSLLSTYLLYSSVELKADFIWGKCQLASIACSITVGYMTGDLLVSVIRWKEVGELAYVFHHLCSALAFLYVILTGRFKFFAMVRLLAEYSTIFVNLRGALHSLGMQKGLAYFYNGLLMVFSFTFARILPLPVYLYCVYTIMDEEDYQNSYAGKLVIWGSTLVLDTLNVLWYKKMIKGAIKVWNSQKESNLQSVPATGIKDIKQG